MTRQRHKRPIHTRHAVPMPCSDHAALKATSPRPQHSTVGTRHGVCELKSLWTTCIGSASSDHYTDIHEGC